MSNTIYNICTAQDLLKLSQEPDADYILMHDLDMADIPWTPVEAFSGTFNGNGKTISNLKICGERRRDIGFFGEITPKGQVQNLHIENVCVYAGAQALYVGTIAGTNCGKVQNCTATGEIMLQELAVVGCLVGRLKEGAELIPGTELSYTDPQGRQTQGLAAIMKLFPTNVVVGLAGRVPEGYKVVGRWMDISRRFADLPKAFQTRRKKSVDYMVKMSSVLWTPTKTLVYMPKVSFKPAAISFQIYLEGKTYKGIPYNHSHGSLERFMACLDEDHRIRDWVNNLGPASIDDRRKEPYETSGFAQYIGNDCSGAVYWAWLQVSPSEVADVPWGRGVRINLCQNIVPNDTNIASSGVCPVGNYVRTCPEGPELTMTEDMVKHSGEQMMFESYAMAYPGDAILANNRNKNDFGSSGHMRMLTHDPVVIRDGQGRIDPYKSYLITIEQGDGQMDSRVYTEKYSWRVNYQHTFRMLIDGAENCANQAYVPVTMRAFWDNKVAKPYVKIISASRGELYSNYRITSTTLKVSNAAGKTVYEKEVFTGVDGNGDNFTERPEARCGNMFSQTVFLKEAHARALDALAPGESYRYELSVLVSNGTRLCRDNDGIILSGTGIKQ